MTMSSTTPASHGVQGTRGAGTNVILFLVLLVLMGLHELTRPAAPIAEAAAPERELLTPADKDRINQVGKIVIKPAPEESITGLQLDPIPPMELERIRIVGDGPAGLRNEWTAASHGHHLLKSGKVAQWLEMISGLKEGELRVTAGGETADKQALLEQYGLVPGKCAEIQIYTSENIGRGPYEGLIAMYIGDAPQGDEMSMDRPRFVRIGRWQNEAADGKPGFVFSDEIRLLPETDPSLDDAKAASWLDLRLTIAGTSAIDINDVQRMQIEGTAIDPDYAIQRFPFTQPQIDEALLAEIEGAMQGPMNWFLGVPGPGFLSMTNESADELKARPVVTAFRDLSALEYHAHNPTGSTPREPFLYVRAYLGGSITQLRNFWSRQNEFRVLSMLANAEAQGRGTGQSRAYGLSALGRLFRGNQVPAWLTEILQAAFDSGLLLPADVQGESVKMEINHEGSPRVVTGFAFPEDPAEEDQPTRLQIRVQVLNTEIEALTRGGMTINDQRRAMALDAAIIDLQRRLFTEDREPTEDEQRQMMEIENERLQIQLAGMSQSIELTIWEDTSESGERASSQPQTQPVDDERTFLCVTSRLMPFFDERDGLFKMIPNQHIYRISSADVNKLMKQRETMLPPRKIERPDDLPAPEIIGDDQNPRVKFVTNHGELVLELFEDETPNHVANIISLVEQKFYDDTQSHRLIPGFMVQFGCPNTRDGIGPDAGTGGPGYRFEYERGNPERSFTERGLVAMANSGRDSNGSQFFITFAAAPHLNYTGDDGRTFHSIFGQLVEGQDVLTKLEAIRTASGDRPEEPVIIHYAHVLAKRDHPYTVQKVADEGDGGGDDDNGNGEGEGDGGDGD